MPALQRARAFIGNDNDTQETLQTPAPVAVCPLRAGSDGGLPDGGDARLRGRSDACRAPRSLLCRARWRASRCRDAGRRCHRFVARGSRGQEHHHLCRPLAGVEGSPHAAEEGSRDGQSIYRRGAGTHRASAGIHRGVPPAPLADGQPRRAWQHERGKAGGGHIDTGIHIGTRDGCRRVVAAWPPCAQGRSQDTPAPWGVRPVARDARGGGNVCPHPLAANGRDGPHLVIRLVAHGGLCRGGRRDIAVGRAHAALGAVRRQRRP